MSEETTNVTEVIEEPRPESAGVLVETLVEPAADGPSFAEKSLYLLREILVTIVLFLVLRNLVVQARFIPSASMHPGLLEGDRLLVELVMKRLTDFDRGEILVFYKPGDEQPNFVELIQSSFGMHDDHAMIKRIVGLPGDIIEVIPNLGVKVNGILLDEPYVAEAASSYTEPFTVPAGHLFMMGDNRNQSADSRSWGTLPIENIIGKATVRFYPFKRMGLIR